MLNNLKMKKFSKDEARGLNPLQLALIGDGVYEVYIRNYILSNNLGLSAHKIHKEAIIYVRAEGQAKIMHSLVEELTEEELNIYKRGRNAKSATIPKNANVRDYRMATGFEALIGYLYLIGEDERLSYLLEKSRGICK